MTARDQVKLLDVGLTIIRERDYEGKRRKYIVNYPVPRAQGVKERAR